ncbi:MAG: tetratricopeptide repeat protein, partial [Acidobacteria bacterium]|nr:tetratricopeptide repeat protein [Acidobacteriota bacterium]
MMMAGAAGAAESTGDKAADDYNMGVWLYGSKKYELAADEFRSFLQKHPDHEKVPDARLGMARALLHAGKNDEAIAALSELRQKHPKFERMPEALFHLGQALTASGKTKEAAAVYQEIAANYGDHYLADWARARRGEALVMLNEYDEAEKTLAPLVERFLTGKDADKRLKEERDRLQKQAPGVAAGFDALLERAHLNLGLARFGAGRFDPARQTFEEFLALAPKSALADTARFHLAQSLYKAGQFDRAADVYKEIAKGKGDVAADAAFERALALYQAKKHKEAAEAFADCAKRFPQAPRAAKARLYAGTCLYLTKDYRAAIERLKGEDQDPEALYWLAMAYLRENKSAEARAAFEKVLAAGDGPRAADALLGKADALLAEGKNDEAAQAYQQFAGRFGQHEDLPRALYAAAASLHRAGKYEPSDQFCGQFLEKNPQHDLAAQVLFISGENRFLLKKYPEAAARYKALVETRADSSDVPAARFRLAWIRYFEKDCDGALAALAGLDSAKADPDVAAEAEYLRGNCLLEKKDNPAAAEAFGKYLGFKDAKRYRDDALLKSAMALDRAGQRAEAVARLNQFMSQQAESPLRPDAEYMLADALAAEKKYDQASAHYKAVAEKSPDHRLAPYALYGLGTCLTEKGATDEAVAAFGRLAEKHPQSDLAPQALYQKAVATAKAGKFAEARAAYKAMVDGYPNHELAPAAMLGLGLALEKEKKYDEAAVAFRRLIDATKDDKTREQAAYELAWSLQEAGKDKEAADAYAALARDFPNSPLSADAFFHLAEVPYRDKKYDEAVALYEKSLAASKDDRLKDKILYRLGWCRWAGKKYP